MTTLHDAKPCPFCGSTRIVKGERYFAMCVDCGATGPERTADATVRKFTGDWNTRYESQAKVKERNYAAGFCMQWGCESAALIYLRVGQSQQTMNGFLTASVAGWYCPVCAGSYGDY